MTASRSDEDVERRRSRIGSEAPRRIGALAAVGALVAAGAVVAGAAPRQPPRTSLQPTALAAEAAPPGSQSQGWYCAGGAGSSALVAASQILVVNTGPRPVRGTLEVVDTEKKVARAGFTVPAHGQIDEQPERIVPGDWLAARVEADGGAVSASEVVGGSTGWAVTPCASETASTWYFAAGSTASGNGLRVSVFNPTQNLSVVDLSFLTSRGETAPQPYQGLIVEPGALVSVTVGTYVQDQKQVAAVVTARSGAVVATELQTFKARDVSGVAFRLGAPVVSRAWDLPRAEDGSGATSALSVLNPTARAEHVTVRVRLASGSVAPFRQEVGPDSVWTLTTGEEIRIPAGTQYAISVLATGGPGVVVDRTASGGVGGSSSRQWGDDPTVDAAAERSVTQWVLPSVARLSGLASAPLSLVLQNPGRHPVVAKVSSMTQGVVHRLARVTVRAGGFATISGSAAPMVVTADGPLAIAGDRSPLGAAVPLVVTAISER